MPTKTTPERSTAEAEQRFWDRQAPSYAKKPVPDEAAYQQTLDRVRHHLRGDDQVLEIGCGTGSTALELATSCGSLHATDLSPGMIDIAKEKARAAALDNLSFSARSLDGIDSPAEGYDVVMTFNLLHLLPQLDEQLIKISALIRPGGLFITKTPCLAEKGKVMRYMVTALRLIRVAPYVNFFSCGDLERAVAGAQLEIVEKDRHPAKEDKLFIVARTAS